MGAICIGVTNAANVFNPPATVCLFSSERDLNSYRLAKEVLGSGQSLTEVVFTPSDSPIYDVGSFSKHEIIVSNTGYVLLRSEIPESGEYVETLIGDILSSSNYSLSC